MSQSCAAGRPPPTVPAVTLRHRPLASRFPARLREARERSGLTQAQLGQQVGYGDRQGLGAVERGDRGCTTELCCRLAAALGVSPCWLAYGLELDGGSWEGYGARLRELRTEEGLSVRAGASRLGYAAAGGLQALEAERSRLDLDQAEMIARAYQAPPAWLAFGVGER